MSFANHALTAAQLGTWSRERSFPKAISVQDPAECSEDLFAFEFSFCSFQISSLLFSWSSCICLKTYLSLLCFSPISALPSSVPSSANSSRQPRAQTQLRLGKFSRLQEFQGLSKLCICLSILTWSQGLLLSRSTFHASAC